MGEVESGKISCEQDVARPDYNLKIMIGRILSNHVYATEKASMFYRVLKKVHVLLWPLLFSPQKWEPRFMRTTRFVVRVSEIYRMVLVDLKHAELLQVAQHEKKLAFTLVIKRK